MSLCKVCETARSRYKCPGCELAYCCVSCYQSHCPSCLFGGKRPPKAPAVAAVAAGAAGGGGAAPLEGKEAEDDELQARLPADLLERLCGDPTVASAMSDPRLCRILAAIDRAPDRVAALEAFKRKEGAPLRNFLDDVLVTMGVAQRVPLAHGGSGIEFLGLPNA